MFMLFCVTSWRDWPIVRHGYGLEFTIDLFLEFSMKNYIPFFKETKQNISMDNLII